MDSAIKENPTYGATEAEGVNAVQQIDTSGDGDGDHDMETQRTGRRLADDHHDMKQLNPPHSHSQPMHTNINAKGADKSTLIPSTILVQHMINNDESDLLYPPLHSPMWHHSKHHNKQQHHQRRRRSRSSSVGSYRTKAMDELTTIAESVFSDIRSESSATIQSIKNEVEVYDLCTSYQRAFPERSFALLVTLLFELPTLFLISGGSDRLCTLIGRKKYTTLVSLLPLISAISGNVGLQASTLTTRAISHGQVRVDNYSIWLGKEILAAMYLGFAIGTVISIISFCSGGFSLPFAISIFTAQFIGILTAGCTGTLAPLLFTFIFQRDSGKWGGPLETAVQDVVGSFAMIVVTYRIMLFFGPFVLEPSDMC